MELIREDMVNKINIRRYYRLYNLSYVARDQMVNRGKNEIYRKELIENCCKN